MALRARFERFPISLCLDDDVIKLLRHNSPEDEEEKKSAMRDKLFKPDIFTFTGFLLTAVIQDVSCRPKGGRGGGRGGSVAMYGGGGLGRLYFTSARWAVLSPATKVLILIFCIVLGIFLIVGMYRAYMWCTKDPVRR